MPKPTFNVMQALRLQIKIGYMKTPPSEYEFLRRYPPLNRDSRPPIRKIEVHKSIPYAKYYENAVEVSGRYNCIFSANLY